MALTVLTSVLLFGFSIAFMTGPQKVCYDHVGCFDTSSHFDNAWGYLPESPEDVHVNFRLFTRDSPEKERILDETDPGSVSEANFDAEKSTKFIIHGYESSGNVAWVVNMTKMFLKKEDCNVIVVDWKEGAAAFYPQAVANTRLTAAITANLIRVLSDQFGLDLNSIHLIGHSLGAHICGYIGHRVPGTGRITGLDPAGPLFEKTDISVRLDPSDAIFVDTIHSDGTSLINMGFGTLERWGHVDFYPNGGTQQPGCANKPLLKGVEEIFTLDFKDIVHTVDCSHTRAALLFTDTIVNDNCQFLANPCSTKEQFDQGKCTSCPKEGCPMMGYNAHQVAVSPGRYYLTTNAQSPFCQSQ